MISMTVTQLIAALGIPTALTGFFFWFLQRKIDKREKLNDEREQKREKNEILIIKSVNAAIGLGEAAAIALRNGHTNGETEAALARAKEVKREQADFLAEQGIHSMY